MVGDDDVTLWVSQERRPQADSSYFCMCKPLRRAMDRRNFGILGTFLTFACFGRKFSYLMTFHTYVDGLGRSGSLDNVAIHAYVYVHACKNLLVVVLLPDKF